jgi:hypothetical protein
MTDRNKYIPQKYSINCLKQQAKHPRAKREKRAKKQSAALRLYLASCVNFIKRLAIKNIQAHLNPLRRPAG